MFHDSDTLSHADTLSPMQTEEDMLPIIADDNDDILSDLDLTVQSTMSTQDMLSHWDAHILSTFSAKVEKEYVSTFGVGVSKKRSREEEDNVRTCMVRVLKDIPDSDKKIVYDKLSKIQKMKRK